MNPRELDADRMLRALGSLQRAERAELADLEEAASELASREPERQRALEDRLLVELLSGPQGTEEAPGLAARGDGLLFETPGTASGCGAGEGGDDPAERTAGEWRVRRGTSWSRGLDEGVMPLCAEGSSASPPLYEGGSGQSAVNGGVAEPLPYSGEREGRQTLKARCATISRRAAAERREGLAPLAAESVGGAWRRCSQRRSSRLLPTAAVSFALAAAGMLWLRQPATPPFTVGYTLIAPAPDASSRGLAEQTTPAVYSLGRTLRFALRPSERYEGPLGVTCYAVQDDTVIPLDIQLERDPAGGVHVVLSGVQLAEVLREGSWQLQLYVAPPSAAEVSPALVLAEHCPRDTRCLSFSARFVQPRAL